MSESFQLLMLMVVYFTNYLILTTSILFTQ